MEGASCCPGALRANREQEADLFVVSILRPVIVLYLSCFVFVCCCWWLEGASCCPGALKAKGEPEVDLFVVSILRPVIVLYLSLFIYLFITTGLIDPLISNDNNMIATTMITMSCLVFVCCHGWLEGASCCPGALRAKGEQEADLFCGVCIASCCCPVFGPSCLCLLPVVARVVSFTHWAGTPSYK